MSDPADVPPASRSYRPGDWFGIFGDQVVVVLPPTEKHRVPAVWSLVDDGAGFDEVLDALIADGLRDLPGFVLVSQSGEETKTVIRGAARAELVTADGAVTIAGSGTTTWAERSVSGVRSLRIEVADGEPPDEPADREDLVIRGGLVRISRADAPAYGPSGGDVADEGGLDRLDRRDSPTPVPPAARVVAPPGTPVGPETPLHREDLASPAPVEPETPLHREDLASPAPVEPVETPPVPAAASDVPPPTPAAPDETGLLAAAEPTPGAPSLTEEAGWAQPTPPPARVLPPMPPELRGGPAGGVADVDGPTRAGNWSPGPTPQSAPASALAPVARLIFSSGDVVDVDRPVIVGRAPVAQRFGSGEEPRLVTVPSPHQEISSTHLEIRPGAGADQGTAVVTDLGSTNGTVLVQPGLPADDLQPGIAAQLLPGAVVDLGDGVTIQVSRP